MSFTSLVKTHSDKVIPSKFYDDIVADMVAAEQEIARLQFGTAISGSATSGSATTVVDTAAAFGVNALANAIIYITRNAIAVRADRVVSNTVDTIILASGAVIQPGDGYSMMFDGSTTTTNLASEASVSALKARPPVNDERVWLGAFADLLDGGHGVVVGVTGAAIGTYVDDGCTVYLPTGGDGSSAWLREFSGPVNVRWAGAKGNGTTDDRAAFLIALAASADVYAPAGSYFVPGGLSVARGTILGDGYISQIKTTALDDNTISITGDGVKLSGLRITAGGKLFDEPTRALGNCIFSAGASAVLPIDDVSVCCCYLEDGHNDIQAYWTNKLKVRNVMATNSNAGFCNIQLINCKDYHISANMLDGGGLMTNNISTQFESTTPWNFTDAIGYPTGGVIKGNFARNVTHENFELFCAKTTVETNNISNDNRGVNNVAIQIVTRGTGAAPYLAHDGLAHTINVAGNIIDNVLIGILIRNFDNDEAYGIETVTISNNPMTNIYGQGIVNINKNVGTVISGGSISMIPVEFGGVGDGVTLACSEGRAIGITVRNAPRYGMYVNSNLREDNLLALCTIVGSGAHGIYDAGTGTNIGPNVCKDNGGYGVLSDNSDRSCIHDITGTGNTSGLWAFSATTTNANKMNITVPAGANFTQAHTQVFTNTTVLVTPTNAAALAVSPVMTAYINSGVSFVIVPKNGPFVGAETFQIEIKN